jgi:hypothetical protein
MKVFNVFCVLAIAVQSAYSPFVEAKDLVFSNNFESNTSGFTAGGVITSLTRISLPTDGGGLGSANQSQWLGRLGYNIPKSPTSNEIVTLAVTGLTAGRSYELDFDLLVGGSWDGSAGGYGPDSWRVTVDGTNLVNTTFTNGNQGQEYGAYSPQKYSDSTYLGFTGPNFGKFTGADAFFTTGGTNYGQHYGIYYFGHGAGNPELSFTALGTTASIQFVRYGNTSDSGDEYWALDNVNVFSSVPEPNSLVIIPALMGLVAIQRRRRMKS